MAQKDIEVKVKVDTSEVTESVKSLKQQFREAQLEAQKLAAADVIDQKALDAAIEKTAELKDRMNDVNEQIGVLTAGSPFEKMANGLGDVGSKIASLDFEGAKESAGKLIQISKSITFGEAIKGVKDLGSTFMQLGKALLTNPLFLIGAAIALLVMGIIKLMDKLGLLKVITKAIGDLFNWLMIPINAIIDGLKALTDWFGWTNNAATDAAKQMAENAEKTAAAYEEKSKTVIQGLDNEIRMAELNGESTRKAELKKAYWILNTAKQRAKADIAAYQSAKLQGDLDEEELKALEDKYKASKLAAEQAGSDVKYLKAKFRKEDADAEKKATEEAQKAAEDRNKKIADANKKAAEERKKRREEEAKARLDADRYLTDLLLQNMKDGVDKEIAINNEKYKRLLEANANNALITAEQRKAINDQLIIQQNNENAKLIEADKKAAEEKAKADAEIMLDLANREMIAKAELNATNLEGKLAFLEAQKQLELQQKDLTESEKLLIEQKYKEQADELRKQSAEEEKKRDEEALQRKIDIAKTYAQSVNSLTEGIFALTNRFGKQDEKSKEERAKRQFKVQKALNLSLAVIDGFKAVTTSLAQSPIAIGPVPNPAGIASLAFAVVTSLANIAKIASSQYGGGGSGPSNAGVNAASAASSSAVAPATPQFNLFGTPNQGNNATGTKSAEAKTPTINVNASVSVDEITDTQKKVAKVSESATL